MSIRNIHTVEMNEKQFAFQCFYYKLSEKKYLQFINMKIKDADMTKPLVADASTLGSDSWWTVNFGESEAGIIGIFEPIESPVAATKNKN